MKFSIIIPAYNVAEYISRCLDSIICDEYPTKEIIIIDDGSSDNLNDKIRPYVLKYPWIRIINQKNGGQSSARNLGIEVATGDYIVFVDADDFWVEKPLRYFAEIIKRTNCDVIKSDYSLFVGDLLVQRRVLDFPYFGKKLSALDYLRYATENNHYEVIPWAGCFRRSLLNQNRFREGVKYEDHEFSLRVLLSGATVVQIPNQYYAYFSRPGSTTKSHDVSKLADCLFNFRMMHHLVDSKARNDDEKKLFFIPVAMIIQHALMVWWRLPFATAMRSTALFSSDALNFSAKYSNTRTRRIQRLFRFSPALTWVIARIKILLGR